MVDIARDPRWGRVAEGAGEDPYLGSVLARARVRGFQGDDYAQPDRVVATAKHWVALRRRRGRAATTTRPTSRSARCARSTSRPSRPRVDAGVGHVHERVQRHRRDAGLRQPLHADRGPAGRVAFDGLVVSDYTSVLELLKHGVAADEAEAARKALTAGVDMEMVSRLYVRQLPALVKQGAAAGRRSWTKPCAASCASRSAPASSSAPTWTPPGRRRRCSPPSHGSWRASAAARSMVLLRNEGGVLPLRKDLKTIAVIGPLADDRQAVLGTWLGDGTQGGRGERPGRHPGRGGQRRPACSTRRDARSRAAATRASRAAVDAARGADAVVLVVGEAAEMSGEAASRSVLDLPGRQMDLVRAVHGAGRPTGGGAGERPAPHDRLDRRERARHPRGVARRDRGGPRDRRRALRRRESWREAAHHLPALRRPGPDLLRAQEHRPPARRPRSTPRSISTSR